jgi:hypothetical protein
LCPAGLAVVKPGQAVPGKGVGAGELGDNVPFSEPVGLEGAEPFACFLIRRVERTQPCSKFPGGGDARNSAQGVDCVVFAGSAEQASGGDDLTHGGGDKPSGTRQQFLCLGAAQSEAFLVAEQFAEDISQVHPYLGAR